MSALLDLAEIDVPEADDASPMRWTREQYYELARIGLFHGRRVQLIEGELVFMPPMNYPHAVGVSKSQRKLETVFGTAAWVRSQLPLHLAGSEPEPDVSVVPGHWEDYAEHPTTALLVVEVADTTLSYDRGKKAVMYAKAGIADYWVLDLNGQRLLVLRSPTADGYAAEAVFKRMEYVAPLALLNMPVKVADLLP